GRSVHRRRPRTPAIGGHGPEPGSPGCPFAPRPLVGGPLTALIPASPLPRPAPRPGDAGTNAGEGHAEVRLRGAADQGNRSPRGPDRVPPRRAPPRIPGGLSAAAEEGAAAALGEVVRGLRDDLGELQVEQVGGAR